MKAKSFYKNNKHNNMDSKEKENIKKMVRENAKTKDERVEQVIEEPKQKQEEKERL